MNRTRFTPWVVLACIGTLAACTSTEGGPSGNTELNIILPNQGPGASTTGQTQVECNTVEYTIVCAGGEQPAGGFLNPNDGFADAVTLNGNLQVDDNVSPYPVAQGFMDIPPGDCLVQLRCRDADDEVVCAGDNTLFSDINVDAGETQRVNIVLDCYNISYQAPVGQLDVRGDFVFSVGNFCPDLFVLNCVDTVLGPDGIDPGPEVEGETTCEVRFRDNDDGCNEGCDPQVCFEDTNGLLTCSAASPPEDQNGTSMAGVEVRTTVTCDRGTIDCLGAPSPGGNACTFDGDQLGTLAVSTEILPNDPAGPSAFQITCNPGVDAGQTITCEAYTTDGDRDCDKTKIVQVSCPGLTPCGTLGDNNGENPDQSGGDAVCAAQPATVCRADVCNDATCDGNDTSLGACCERVDVDDGTDCSTENGGLAAECQGGVCTGLDCGTVGCEDQNDCTQPTVCNDTTGACEPNPPIDNDGAICDVSWGSGAQDGVCNGDTCETFVCSATDTSNCTTPPSGVLACYDVSCNLTNTPAGECVYTTDDTNFCDSCTGGVDCECSGGVCNDPVPVLATCDPTGQGNVTTCLSPFVLADDCFVVTGSVPVPVTPIVTPTEVLFDGKPTGLIPQGQASLPWPLLCTLAGPAGGGADLKDSALEIVQASTLVDTPAYTYVDPTGVFNPAAETPHGVVPLDFNAACQAQTDITVNLFASNVAGLCTGNSLANGGTCVGGDLDGASCTWNTDCYPTETLDLSDLANSLGPNQFLAVVPTGQAEFFGFTHEGLAIDLGDVLPPAAPNVCLGGGCPIYGTGTLGADIPSIGQPVILAQDGCPPTDRTGDGVGGDPNDSPRIMYDANCSTADVVGGTGCTPFVTGDDALEVLACDLGTDTTNPNWGQSCTVATADADCGTGVACTLQTVASLFTSPDPTFTASGFPNLTDCCNAAGAGIDAGETPGCSAVPDLDPPRTAACAAILALYPTATQAQWVPVPVNACVEDGDCTYFVPPSTQVDGTCTSGACVYP